jgi:hypothetical protein
MVRHVPVEKVIELVVFLSTNVEDLVWSNLTWGSQELSHMVDANSRVLLPVSNTTLTSWGGVPTEMLPNHLPCREAFKLLMLAEKKRRNALKVCA